MDPALRRVHTVKFTVIDVLDDRRSGMDGAEPRVPAQNAKPMVMPPRTMGNSLSLKNASAESS
jgi:hypothetical protein